MLRVGTGLLRVRLLRVRALLLRPGLLGVRRLLVLGVRAGLLVLGVRVGLLVLWGRLRRVGARLLLRVRLVRAGLLGVR
ncbi:hypothetical protein, partial [Streptomyces benahoarensis]